MVSNLATVKIKIFLLVFVAEHSASWFDSDLSENPKTGFLPSAQIEYHDKLANSLTTPGVVFFGPRAII